MDAIQTLKTAFRRIPPVGNPISLKRQPLTHPLFDKDKSQLYQSGTAALAAAVLVAKKKNPCEKPEVIIPAYGCPDLVSAIIYAQCKPILVDIEGDTPYLKLDELETKISDQTIAVIAPWFLGIPERFKQIRTVIQKHNILLIEDSAQWFPEEPLEKAYCGDLVVLSFGKGKPVSLLGGGLLYTTQHNLHSSFPKPQTAKETKHWILLGKYLAFNAVIHPWFYWLLELLPVTMGKTVYKPLTQLLDLPAEHSQHLQSNIADYLSRPIRAQKILTKYFRNISLTSRCETFQQQRLLRFPLILPNVKHRKYQLEKMQRQGLGASHFYPNSLPNIEQIPDSVKDQGSFPGAVQFSKQLITLPTHLHTADKQLHTLDNIIENAEKPLRVIHVASGDLWGGAEVQLYTLAKQLHADANVDISVVLMNEGKLANELKQRGITTHIFDEQRQNSAQILIQLISLFKHEKPNIIHTHRQKENILASIANLLSIRATSIRTQHGASEFNYRALQVSKHLNRLLDWFAGRFLQNRIIAVSDELADKLAQSFPRSHIVTIANGVDVKEIQANAITAEFKLKQPNHHHIGIVGRLVPVKRVDLFLQTAKLLLEQKLSKPLQFHVLGDGPLRIELESQTKSLVLADKVTFHGHCDDISSYLASLDLLVMCSDHEGLPMTALEAMTLGTPIVSHNIGALKPVLDQAIGGLLASEHKATAYCTKVCQLLRTPELNKTITKRGYEQVCSNYTSIQNKNATLSAYFD